MARKPTMRNMDEDGTRRVTIRIQKDGSLNNSRAEILALMLSEEIPLIEAWPMIPGATGEPGNNTGGSARYRNKILQHPSFKQRMATLAEEKQVAAEDTIFGQAKWTSMQLWRMAVAKLDLPAMTKASAQVLEIAKLTAGVNPGEDGQPAARPGKPSVTNPSVDRNPSQLRRELLSRGMKAAPQVPPDDETDADAASETVN